MIEPWAALAIPQAGALSARRVYEKHKWNFYWAVDSNRSPMLLLECGTPDDVKTRLPELQGIRLSLHHQGTSEVCGLAIALLDSAQDELFLALCEDLIVAGEGATTSERAMQLVLQRLWRWHYLLGRGKQGDLTLDEEAGLLAEIAVLQRHFLPGRSSMQGLECWKGPLGAAQDFLLPGLAVEVKAAGVRKQSVRISSEFQLDSMDGRRVYLVAIPIARTDSGEGMTLRTMVNHIRSGLQHDPAALNRFDSLVAAAGYLDEGTYDRAMTVPDEPWRIYRVEGSFPALTRSGIPSAVQKVSYELDLRRCAEFRVEEAVLQDAIQSQV